RSRAASALNAWCWISAVHLSFFFQAEDGIRDFHVTGVQTCALPILASGGKRGLAQSIFQVGGNTGSAIGPIIALAIVVAYGRPRSEERRVGKECRSRWAGDA